MPLTEQQKQQLQRLPVQKIIEYIDKGQVSYPFDLTYLDDSKRAQVDAEMSGRPDPAEVSEWSKIVPLLDQNDDQLLSMLSIYITNWNSRRPVGNHVDEAADKCEQIEKDRWESVDTFSRDSLMGYFHRYPNTAHKSDIDDNVWSLSANPVNVTLVRQYMVDFPQGNHIYEASRIVDSWNQWENIKNGGDIFAVKQYVDSNPDTPWYNEAFILLSQLKNDELDQMRHNASSYSKDRLLGMVDKSVFTEHELVKAGVMSPKALVNLRNLQSVSDALPDIGLVIDKCTKECLEDHTDVYLFGIPSTGKTCVLMGLVGSEEININTKIAGGEYAGALMQYVDAGFTPPRTYGTFVTTLEGCFKTKVKDTVVNHYVNLVEMSGEEFAFKLAQNDDNEVTLMDMGDGAPALLSNNNRKSFFLIVDPTVEYVVFKRLHTICDDDGNVVDETVSSHIVSQKITLKKMVDLLSLPENESVMELVDSLHFIVTKSDTLDEDPIAREEKAVARFMQYHKGIIQPLTDLCNKYGINSNTKGVPMLFTFSLGKFYPGGIYEYNPTDANKLIEVLGNITKGERSESFWHRFLSAINKKLL